ncbi:MAG: deoxyribodipyrimidine photo-lyase [Flavobacteriaceae bacterium]|nr:deoxyribodipyrimidine photo-lyase [Flavobacteriaceae bacterium]
MDKNEIAVFWFRRDLRLDDNTGLRRALESGLPVLPLFIFDESILDDLPETDARVTFIYRQLETIHRKLESVGSGLVVKKGKPLELWKVLNDEFNIKKVFFNKDYEPYARTRDQKVIDLLLSKGIAVYATKDQVIFEKDEILKEDGTPYTVYTPYKNKWLDHFKKIRISFDDEDTGLSGFIDHKTDFPGLESIGFKVSKIGVPDYKLDVMDDYGKYRDFPARDHTSHVSTHLRFGTVSIRKLVQLAAQKNPTFLSELIWREFFMQILYQFPKVVTENFKSQYDGIKWRNDEIEFDKWCRGETGYPIVDAGMRQLNTTGFMHNRVRMITASFLCKHLLIDWRWGERYFAKKLLDYELAANNGNWQWGVGTGCDAAPYFRIFNPTTQMEKFDKDLEYVKKWVPEFRSVAYKPIVEHTFARQRAIDTYKAGLKK